MHLSKVRCGRRGPSRGLCCLAWPVTLSRGLLTGGLITPSSPALSLSCLNAPTNPTGAESEGVKKPASGNRTTAAQRAAQAATAADYCNICSVGQDGARHDKQLRLEAECPGHQPDPPGDWNKRWPGAMARSRAFSALLKEAGLRQ